MCVGCGKQFVDSLDKHKQFPRTVRKTGADLRHDGLPLQTVRKRVSAIYRMTVRAASTIWYWSREFAAAPADIITGLAARLHADETLLKTYKKGLLFYFWALKCPETKCIVGSHVSLQRTMQDTKQLLWDARRHFPPTYLPKVIRTDKMPSYRFAVMQVFNYSVQHEQMLSFKHGNNVIENFWRCKNRFPRFRTLDSARYYIATWIAEYNRERLEILEITIIRLLKTIGFFR